MSAADDRTERAARALRAHVEDRSAMGGWRCTCGAWIGDTPLSCARTFIEHQAAEVAAALAAAGPDPEVAAEARAYMRVRDQYAAERDAARAEVAALLAVSQDTARALALLIDRARVVPLTHVFDREAFEPTIPVEDVATVRDALRAVLAEHGGRP